MPFNPPNVLGPRGRRAQLFDLFAQGARGSLSGAMNQVGASWLQSIMEQKRAERAEQAAIAEEKRRERAGAKQWAAEGATANQAAMDKQFADEGGAGVGFLQGLAGSYLPGDPNTPRQLTGQEAYDAKTKQYVSEPGRPAQMQAGPPHFDFFRAGGTNVLGSRAPEAEDFPQQQFPTQYTTVRPSTAGARGGEYDQAMLEGQQAARNYDERMKRERFDQSASILGEEGDFTPQTPAYNVGGKQIEKGQDAKLMLRQQEERASRSGGGGGKAPAVTTEEQALRAIHESLLNEQSQQKAYEAESSKYPGAPSFVGPVEHDKGKNAGRNVENMNKWRHQNPIFGKVYDAFGWNPGETVDQRLARAEGYMLGKGMTVPKAGAAPKSGEAAIPPIAQQLITKHIIRPDSQQSALTDYRKIAAMAPGPEKQTAMDAWEKRVKNTGY